MLSRGDAGRYPRPVRRALTYGLAVACFALLPALDWPGQSARLAAEFATASPARRLEIVLTLPVERAAGRAEVLTSALADEDPRVRRAALRSLRPSVDAALAGAVLPLLNSEQPAQREMAAEALGRLEVSSAVATLTRSLGDADPAVRRASITAVARLGGPDAVLSLLDRVNDPDATVRREAVSALGRSGDLRAVLPLTGALQDPVTPVRLEAIAALGALHDRRAIRGLQGLIGDPNLELALAAVRVLGSLGDAAVPCLDDLAALALRSAPERDGPSRSALARAALEALGQIGGAGAASVLARALVAARDASEAHLAAAGLRRLGRVAEGEVSRLAAAPSGVFEAALSALGGIGGPEATRALVRLAEGPEGLTAPAHRPALLAALGQTADPQARALLVDTLARSTRDRDPHRVAMVLSALGQWSLRADGFDPLSVDVVMASLGVLDPRAVTELEAALRLLGRSENPRVLNTILAFRGHPQQSVRVVCIEALGRLGDAATASLVDALGDPSSRVRGAAADALATGPSLERLEALCDALESARALDRSAGLRAAGRIVAALAPRAPRVDRALARLVAFDDPRSEARSAALYDALGSPRAFEHSAVRALLTAPSATARLDAARRDALGHALVAPEPALLAPSRRDAGAARGPDGTTLAARWHLGRLGPNTDALGDALDDADDGLAGTAAGGLALAAETALAPELVRRLCALRGRASLYAQVNATHALARHRARCDDRPRQVVAPLLRAAEARWASSLAQSPEALERCAAADPSPSAAGWCRSWREPSAPRTLDVAVLGPDGEALGDTTVVLVRPDGVLRMVAPGPDGWVHERPVGAGEFSVRSPDGLSH